VGKVLERTELAAELARLRRQGRRIVFTNGCFDLLHPGHVDLLDRCRTMGDVLVVAINSDAGVRALKGPGRPLAPQAERAELLAALQAVDYVTFFDEPTPREIIIELHPDTLVKGGDWGLDGTVGREEVTGWGGVVVSAALLPGYSTSAIVKKVLASVP
jgi:D-beta-D-heptose 7-phosphate kinase/D-beta-D-heptose 1-phosphate adenosyltransferase